MCMAMIALDIVMKVAVDMGMAVAMVGDRTRQGEQARKKRKKE